MSCCQPLRGVWLPPCKTTTHAVQHARMCTALTKAFECCRDVHCSYPPPAHYPPQPRQATHVHCAQRTALTRESLAPIHLHTLPTQPCMCADLWSPKESNRDRFPAVHPCTPAPSHARVLT